jgi:hypothetical protein
MTAGLALMFFIAVGWPLALAAYAVLNDASPSSLPFFNAPGESERVDETPPDDSPAPDGSRSASVVSQP